MIEKLICLIKGHAWAGGSFHILSSGGIDMKFCGRCCQERGFVD